MVTFSKKYDEPCGAFSSLSVTVRNSKHTSAITHLTDRVFVICIAVLLTFGFSSSMTRAEGLSGNYSASLTTALSVAKSNARRFVDDANSGHYIMSIGKKQWGEFFNGQQTPRFTFKEVKRDDKNITLKDKGRGIKIRLPLKGKKVKVDLGKGGGWEVLFIANQEKGLSHIPPPNFKPEPKKDPKVEPTGKPIKLDANGRMVTKAVFGRQGKKMGTYRQVAQGKWDEIGKGGQAFHFNEVNRDDWSVYLHDSSRNVRIQLDLHRKQVFYSDGNSAAPRPLYDILTATSPKVASSPNKPKGQTPVEAPKKGDKLKANGRTVTKAVFGRQGKKMGTYLQVAQAKWDEIGSGGQAFHFNEVNRDDWSVYLHDSSRNVRIQLDLHRKQVFYSDGNSAAPRPLYDILAANSPTVASDPKGQNVNSPVEPPKKGGKLKANGRTVTKAVFGRQGKKMGTYRQVAQGKWDEIGSGGQAFHFNEVNRDDWSVYLHDSSRNVRIQLDLHRKQVFYSDAKSANPRPLYDVLTASASAVRVGGTIDPSPKSPIDNKLKANGRTVTHLVIGNKGKRQGAYKQVGQKDWEAIGDEPGASLFHFTETGRDDWSVYLRDGSRQVDVQLDLYRKVVLYSDARSKTPRRINDILVATVNPLPDLDPISKPVQPGSNTRPTEPDPDLDIEVVRLPGVDDRTTNELVDWLIEEAARQENPVCWRDTFDRGFGTPISLTSNPCKPGEDQSAVVCYPKCPAGYDNGGPSCVGQCDDSHNVNCGPLMCGQSSNQCVVEVGNMVLATAELVANIAGAALTGGAANASIKAAKTAAKAGQKVAARTALKTALKTARGQIASKLQNRFGAKVIAYGVKKSARQGGRELAQKYSEMVVRKAAQKIAHSQASQIPELREIMAMVDPTGVVGVINAFDKPLCGENPMPGEHRPTGPIEDGFNRVVDDVGEAGKDYATDVGETTTNTLKDLGILGTSKNEWRVDIDSCHGDLDSTDTTNKITVEFWSKNLLVVYKSKNGVDANCNSSDESFITTSDYTITHVIVKTNGGNAFFIDELYLYKGGNEKQHHGRDDGGGWCLSTQPDDAKGNWKGTVSECVSQVQFNY